MVTLHACLIATAVAVAPQLDPVLLDFYAPGCTYCRQMEPTLARLQQDGFRVRRINVNDHPELARQYGVVGLPTFVLVGGQKQLDRVEGATSYARLTQMFTAANRSAAAGGSPQVRAQSPDRPEPLVAPPGNSSKSSNSSGNDVAAEVSQRALAATVRIKIKDERGTSYGTGTIIDTHGADALIMTCGHIFRDSQGQGHISVDLFQQGQVVSVPGKLVAWEAKERDIGLVAFRPQQAVQTARVAPTGKRFSRDDVVFSIGCDRGAPPTVRTSRIAAINKFLGPPNVEVAGAPVDGRSGGGLFNRDGELIGVCNAADPQDDEGIYAALGTIHWQLERVGQARLFQPPVAQQPSRPAASDVAQGGERPPLPIPAMGSRMQPLAPVPSSSNPLAEALADGGRAEVIFIVRPRDGSPSRQQVLLLDQLPPELVQRLIAAGQAPASVARSHERGPIIRAQSRN